jgi:hypothetical protein
LQAFCTLIVLRIFIYIGGFLLLKLGRMVRQPQFPKEEEMRKPKFKLRKGKRYNMLFFQAPKDTTAAQMAIVFDSLFHMGFDVSVKTSLPQLHPARENDGTWKLTCSPRDERKVIQVLADRFDLVHVRTKPETLEIFVAKEGEPELQYDDGCS